VQIFVFFAGTLFNAKIKTHVNSTSELLSLEMAHYQRLWNKPQLLGAYAANTKIRLTKIYFKVHTAFSRNFIPAKILGYMVT